MPYSSGTYSLPSGNPVVTGTTISSSTTNTTNSDIATALSTCVLKDGTQTITANLPMASHKLTGLSAGTTAGDSVEYGGSPSFTNLAYTGTLTGSTGILNIGSGQVYKDASGNVGIGTATPAQKLQVAGNIAVQGSTSGTVTLQAPAVAGSTVLTLPATTGTVLTSASTISGTQGASMVLIGSATASASATIDFTSISNTSYSAYRMIIANMIPTTNGVNLLLRFSNSGVFASSSYTWQNWRWTTAGTGVTGQGATGTGIALTAAASDTMANTATHGGSWVIDIYDCAQTTAYHRINYQGYYLGSAQLGIVGNGMSPSTTAIDGFRLLMDSGTIASGTVYLYGVKNA